MRNSNIQENTAGVPNEPNDQDSESSFMSGGTIYWISFLFIFEIQICVCLFKFVAFYRQ